MGYGGLEEAFGAVGGRGVGDGGGHCGWFCAGMGGLGGLWMAMGMGMGMGIRMGGRGVRVEVR